jgi:hypothetical protein
LDYICFVMSCDNYKWFQVNYCPDAFHLTGQFTGVQSVIWKLESKFDKVYQGETVTDTDGKLIIPVDDEPLTKDLFQPFSGAYELRCFATDTDGNLQQILFCGQYEYLVLTFNDVTPLPDPNNVIINLDCPSV